MKTFPKGHKFDDNKGCYFFCGEDYVSIHTSVCSFSLAENLYISKKMINSFKFFLTCCLSALVLQNRFAYSYLQKVSTL